MKIALLGAGKTGQKVAQLYPNTVIFNTQNIPTKEKLCECDLVISFLAGDIFLEYIDLLIESKIPVVTGSTGFDWPENAIKSIQENKLIWVRAHNFSLGMNIVKNMIETISKATELYDDVKFNIHDIHHTKKLDAPSGTALSWQDWLDQDAKITSERTGDVVGYHHLEMISSVEKIKVTHEALDRAIFAKGALWVAKKIYEKEFTKTGLNNFSDIVNQFLKI